MRIHARFEQRSVYATYETLITQNRMKFKAIKMKLLLLMFHFIDVRVLYLQVCVCLLLQSICVLPENKSRSISDISADNLNYLETCKPRNRTRLIRPINSSQPKIRQIEIVRIVQQHIWVEKVCAQLVSLFDRQIWTENPNSIPSKPINIQRPIPN